MGSLVNDPKFTGMIPMLGTSITETPFLLHEHEATHDPSPALAELSFRDEGPRNFLESDSDSGRLEAADETDLRIQSG